MKHSIQFILIAMALVSSPLRAAAQVVNSPTAVTYQGLLSRQTNDVVDNPSDGIFDMTFTVFSTNAGGSPVAATITNTAIVVSNGVFTTYLDHGSNTYTGGAYWLEVGVRTNGGSSFTTLSPRQFVGSTPQSIYALNAGTATIASTATNFVGTVAGDVTGAQGATVVASVGGQTAASVATGAVAANSATSSNIPNTIVARDGNGNFNVGSITFHGNPHVPVLPVTSLSIDSSIYLPTNGTIYLPFPATVYAGTNTFLVEEGSTFVGQGAGFGAAANSQDVGVGDYVLSSSPTGPFNTGIGEYALQFNTTGSNNTAGGYQALQNNTTGSNNKADGYQALYSNTNGIGNTANGSVALYANTSGNYNTANGFQALTANSTGSFNTADGVDSLQVNTIGSRNTAFGMESLAGNTSGNLNAADGFQSMGRTTGGSFNSALGAVSLFHNTTGSNNTAAGYSALFNLGNNGGSPGNNTAVGAFALPSVPSGTNNIAVGFQAGSSFTDSESANIDIGNTGVAGENNTIRIGSVNNASTSNIVANTYIAGIWDVPLDTNAQMVVVDSSGHLGTAPGQGTALSLSPALTGPAVGSVGTGSTPEGLAVAGRYAYEVNSSGTLQIFDVNTPGVPALISTTTIGSTPYAIAVAGRYAYVMFAVSQDLQVFDVSDPKAPVALGSAPAPNYGEVAVAGRYAYAVGNAGTLTIYDVDNPNSPVAVGSVGTTPANMVAVSGRYTYVVGSTPNVLQIFDVSAPSSPVLVGNYNGTNAASSVAISGRYAYITTGARELLVIDVSDPTNPSLVGTTAPVGSSPGYVTVGDGFAYMVDYNASGTLYVVDVRNPISPQVVASVATGSAYPDALVVSGRYAYLVAENSNLLQIFALGGGYIQQLEAGYTETGTLQARDNALVGNNLDVRGGLTVSASARVAGGLSVFMPATTNSSNVFIADFSVDGKPGFVSTLDENGNWSATAFYPTSDRNAKENFQSVSPQEVLDKVAALPISRWNYKADKGSEHIGPMAQDFYSAFAVGLDERHIATVDEEGVALAAIQGLNQKLEAEVKQKDARIGELEKRLHDLERAVQSLAVEK